MRLTRRWQHRSRAGLIALATLSLCAFAAGCQGPPFEHVDGASATFNSNHIPTVDRQPSAGASGSQTETSTTVAGESAKSPAASSAAGNDAIVVENLNLGHREAALNRLDQAEVYYRRVLEIQPNNATANHRLAVIADKNRDFARAEHYYLTALRRDARDPDLLSDLGYSYLLQGRREDSERCLLAATRLDPSHPKALHNLSLLYAMSGDYDRSFDALRRAVGESEARVKIARLFPNGRPRSAESDAMIASFQPSEPHDGGSPPAVNSTAADSAAATNMSAPQSATAASGAEPVATFGTNDAPSTAAPPTRVPNAASGRVPDSQINDIFAAIDREPPDEQQPGSTAPSPPPVSRTPGGAPGEGVVGSDAARIQANPGADPLSSMPMWSPPAASLSAPQKASAAFEFNEAAPVPAPTTQHPRAIPTEIVPASDRSLSRQASDKGDAMSQFEAELKKDKPANAVRTNSNGAIGREPLIVARPNGVPSGGNPTGAGDQGKPADNGTWPAPFGSVPPIRIEPRSNPAPLFEPVEGFGPTNDFAPDDSASTPAWPVTNGNPASPTGDGGESSPVIRPRSSN